MGRSIDLVEIIEDIHYDPLVYQFIAPFSTKESLTIDLDLEERLDDVAIQEKETDFFD